MRQSGRRKCLPGLFASILAMAAVSFPANAQGVALKSNVVGDALLNPNLAIEFGLSEKWSLDVSGQLNLWTVGDGHKWRHWVAQPEARYWLCQTFAGHFFALHALGGQFNVGRIDMDFKFLGTDFGKLRDRRYQGWGLGAGLAYGYAWPLSRHWNIEAELGIGWVWTRYDAYPCAECGTRIDHGVHNYVGPTKIAFNIEYVF